MLVGEILAAGKCTIIPDPLNKLLKVDPGTCWTTPPQKLTNRTISYNPEKAGYVELGFLFWISAFLISGILGRALVVKLWYSSPSRPEAQSRLVLRYP